ncbi:hypothetical protein pb186bvf_012354 [Paramecium bursaria]
MLKYYRGFSIKTQIAVLLIIFQVIVLVFLAALILINLSLLDEIFKQASQKIILDQMADDLNLFSHFHKTAIEQIFDRNQKKLYIMQNLYNQKFEAQEPQNCLQNQEDQYAKTSTVCYGIFGKNTTSDTTKFKQLNSRLTYLLLMQDLDLDMYYTNFNDDEYFSIYPGELFGDYHPHKRIWYTTHLTQMDKKLVLSLPFKHFLYNYTMISQTKTLLNNDGNSDGVISVQLNFSKLFQQYKVDEINYVGVLMNLNGDILVAKDSWINGSIYNQSLTGLNIDDFHMIKNNLNNREIQNLGCNIHSDEILCFKNKSNNRDTITLPRYVENNLIIILFLEPEYQINILQQQQSEMNNHFQNTSSTASLYTGIIILGSIILSVMSIYFVSKPIDNIIDCTKFRLYQNKNYFDIFKSRKYSVQTNPLLTKLKLALNRLSLQSGIYEQRKSKQCYQLQNYKYPRQKNKNMEELMKCNEILQKQEDQIFDDGLKISLETLKQTRS